MNEGLPFFGPGRPAKFFARRFPARNGQCPYLPEKYSAKVR